MKVNPGPIPGLPNRIQDILDTQRAASGEARQVLDRYIETVNKRQGEMARDQGLTPEGRQRAMATARRTAGEKAAAELDEVRARADEAHTAVRHYLERHWPKPAAGVEAMLNRQAAWARSRSLLESRAVNARQLLDETDDIETLHALHEELPAWMRANASWAGARVNTRIIDERLAEVTGERTPAALQASIQADAERAAQEPMLRTIMGVVKGELARAAITTAAYEGQEARQRVMAGQA